MKIGNWFKEQTQASSQVVESTIAGFADSIQLLTNPMGWLALLLQAVAPLIDALIMPLKDLFGILANAIAPIFKALYPILAGFAIAIVTVNKAIVDFLKTIFTLLSKIPLIGGMFDGMVNLLGQVSDALGQGIDALKDAEFGASALDKLTNSAEKAANAMYNIPSRLKTAFLRTDVLQATRPAMRQEEPMTRSVGRYPTMQAMEPRMVVNVYQQGDVYGLTDFDDRVKSTIYRTVSSMRLRSTGLAGASI
jgi:hypothetical protein